MRPFADFLREQSKGNTYEELSDALHDLVQREAFESVVAAVQVGLAAGIPVFRGISA